MLADTKTADFLNTVHTDRDAERSLIAAVLHRPEDLYLELSKKLPDAAFVHEHSTWLSLCESIKKGDSLPTTGAEWQAAPDPVATAERLLELHDRRALGGLLGRALDDFGSGIKSPLTIAGELETRASSIQAHLSDNRNRIEWASDTLESVLADAQQKADYYVKHGKPYMGIRSGFGELDTLLQGFQPGLYLLGGTTNKGKTTLAMQIASFIMRTTPVVYATFENSPGNLQLKMLANLAKVDMTRYMQGTGDMTALRRAAETLRPGLRKLAFLNSASSLTIGNLEARIIQAMTQHGADQCFIVVDFLQQWAKASKELAKDYKLTRDKVEVLGSRLREVATAHNATVLAISSLSRDADEATTDATMLATLKESGDLEYMADAVLLLRDSQDEMHLVNSSEHEHTGRKVIRVTVDKVEREVYPYAIAVPKNRHGETGKAYVNFDPKQSAYYSHKFPG